MNTRTRTTATLPILAWLGALAPLAVGAVHERALWLFLAGAGVLALLGVAYRFGPLAGAAALRGVLSIALAAGVSVALVDLAFRPFRAPLFELAPHERFETLHAWNPYLQRYQPNVRFRGAAFGDLASVSGNAVHRQERSIRFETDSLGFRNARHAPAEPFNVVLLGDSFGVGVGTSQEQTWASLIGRGQFRLYNLSFVGSPWHELMNFSLEIDRLKLAPGATVLWALFPGNDLDEAYEAELDPAHWPDGPLARLGNLYRTLRLRSPTRLATGRVWRGWSTSEQLVVEARFIDEQRKLLFYAPYLKHMLRSEADLFQHPKLGALRAVMQRMKQQSDARGLELRVVLLPSKGEVYRWVLEQAPPWSTAPRAPAGTRVFGSLCAELGIPALDLAPSFIRKSRSAWQNDAELFWWYDDTHWNPAGHRLAAREVRRVLVDAQVAREGGLD